MIDIDERLDAALRELKPAIGDDGFTENVLARLPYHAPDRYGPGRWTLAGAAFAGSLATLLLALPVESGFGLLTLSGQAQTLILTVLGVAAVIAVPLVWLWGSWIAASLRRAATWILIFR